MILFGGHSFLSSLWKTYPIRLPQQMQRWFCTIFHTKQFTTTGTAEI